MSTDYVVGFCILSFLAGSLVTMILFTLLDEHLEKRYRGQSEP
jgi:hypothetical protein